MIDPITSAQMREKLEQLFRDAGYSVPELQKYIDDLEQQQLIASGELKKLRLSAARRNTSSEAMNSKLRDALRE